jgi:dCTP deaminase
MRAGYRANGGSEVNPKNDRWIDVMCDSDNPLISPFVPQQVSDGVISYGLGGHGYDIRVADEFEIFTNVGNGAKVVDPKNFDPELLYRYQGPVCTIPPNSFALARSIEYFKLPDWLVGICLGKSTYARVGIITNFTPLEAGWEGHLTIEISNTSPLPALIYANEGIAQVLFFESDRARVAYGDRKGGGKYQGQTGITKARV